MLTTGRVKPMPLAAILGRVDINGDPVELMRHGVEQNSRNFIEMALQRHCGVDLRFDNGETPAQRAVRLRKDDALITLLRNGADVNLAFDSPQAMVQYVIEKNNGEILLACTAAGMALPDDQQQLHQLLSLGLSTNQPATALERILVGGLDVQWRDDQGRTALHHCAGHPAGVPAVVALVKQGADIDAEDQRGLRPLHLAVRNDREAVCEALVALGASTWGVTSAKARLDVVLQWTPLQCAVSLDMPELVLRCLEQAPAPTEDDFKDAIDTARRKKMAGVELVLSSWKARQQANAAASEVSLTVRP